VRDAVTAVPQGPAAAVNDAIAECSTECSPRSDATTLGHAQARARRRTATTARWHRRGTYAQSHVRVVEDDLHVALQDVACAALHNQTRTQAAARVTRTPNAVSRRRAHASTTYMEHALAVV
jgi:hypothetical protein